MEGPVRCALLALVLLLGACSREPSGRPADVGFPSDEHDYEGLVLPAHLADPLLDNTPLTNPVTNAGATLGRVLFHDPNLSRNRTVSCASCHRQELAFADTGRQSVGFLGELTPRNSMSLVNLRFNPRDHLFWDERMTPLEVQVLGPIQHLGEMGMLLPQLLAWLDSIAYYAPLFTAAFGDSLITNQRIARALAQFLRSMVSFSSPYDQARPTFSSFTAQEAAGRQLFLAHCADCHATEHFILIEPRNNGLDLVYDDTGVGFITGDPADEGKFRAPSLRNVAVTPPYMHDGRFATLDEVIEHYSTGVKDHPSLSPPLRDTLAGTVRLLQLDPGEKHALKAFLHTLTDPVFLTDPRWSDPFAP